jgi:hypothetical protein
VPGPGSTGPDTVVPIFAVPEPIATVSSSAVTLYAVPNTIASVIPDKKRFLPPGAGFFIRCISRLERGSPPSTMCARDSHFSPDQS